MAEERHRRFPVWLSRVLPLVAAAILLACGFLAAGAIGCAFLSAAPDLLFRRHPSDQDLIENYHHHRDEFNLLALMLQNETYPLVISPDGKGKCQVEGQKWILASEHDRCRQYVRLLNLLDLDLAVAGRDPVWLYISRSGISISGSSKGYVYSTERLAELVEDTDTSDPYEDTVYRHVEGSWYIFLEAY